MPRQDRPAHKRRARPHVLAPLARSAHPPARFIPCKHSAASDSEIERRDFRRRRRSQGPAHRRNQSPSLSAACPSPSMTRDKPIYHATAVLAAGSEYPSMEARVQMLVRIGFTRRRALQTLLPLTRQMLDNIERLGPRAAWTGPMSRGDYAIVAKHAKRVRSYPREVSASICGAGAVRRPGALEESGRRDEEAQARAREWLRI